MAVACAEVKGYAPANKRWKSKCDCEVVALFMFEELVEG